MIYNIIIALLFALLLVLVIIVPCVECKTKTSEYKKAVAAAKTRLEKTKKEYLVALKDGEESDIAYKAALKYKVNALDEYTKARQMLKVTVNEYNEMIEEFPNNVFAKIFGYKRLED